MLSPSTLPKLQRALAEAGLDGWLLFDFHGANPVAAGVLALALADRRRVLRRPVGDTEGVQARGAMNLR